MSVFSNALVFGAAVGVGGFVIWIAVITFLAHIWPGSSMAFRTQVVLGIGVTIAATVAVSVHDLHLHSKGHQAQLLEQCAERPACIEALRDLIEETEE